jgi:hypothetical protein
VESDEFGARDSIGAVQWDRSENSQRQQFVPAAAHPAGVRTAQALSRHARPAAAGLQKATLR